MNQSRELVLSCCMQLFRLLPEYYSLFWRPHVKSNGKKLERLQKSHLRAEENPLQQGS